MSLRPLFLIFFLLLSMDVYAKCEGTIGGKEGNCAADFSLRNMHDEEVRLSSYQGKVVFLNFWATWCAPCAEEVPSLDRLARRFSGKPFQMLAVSINSEGKSVIEKFYSRLFKDQAPAFATLLDPGQKISKSYGTFKVPETYIIDKSGRIRDKIEGIRDWDDSMIVHYLELLTQEK